MKKELAIIIIILTLAPAIFGILIRDDTRIFTDETPGAKDWAGSYSVLSAQYSFNDYEGHVILRMGGRVREFNALTADEEWSWMPGRVASPNNPTSIDTIDYEGSGKINDVAYISTSKEVTIREGDTESKSDIYWSYQFTDNVHSIRAVDLDGDGRRDDLIVAAGNRIYTFKPADKDGPIDSFQVSITPRIIALADVDSDGENDIVVGTWTTTTNGDEQEVTSGGIVTVYDLSGNRGWSFPQTALNEKVTSIKSYDRDSDGISDDIFVIFTDDSNPDNPDSDLYIVSGGSQVFFTSNVEDVAPADFDMDGIRDDFILLTRTQVFAFDSGTDDTQPSSIGGKSRSDFKTTVDGASPTRFLGVAALSLQTKSGENIYNDAALFSVIKETEDQRAIFFVENLVSEETTTTTSSTTTTTTTSTTTTTLPPQPPTARITGISDGTSVSDGGAYPLSASTSSDPDGQIVSYQWLVDDILRGTNRDFTLNTQGMQTGAHVITLKVTDNDGMVGVTTITVSIAKGNVPPLAKAGDDVAVLKGTLVTLSAEGSSDPDGEIESYEWSENGTVFSLEKTVEKIFSLGKHTITLKVKDNRGAASTDKVVVTVVKENLPPKAVAGDDQTIFEGESVHFSAAASTDPDGKIESFLWQLPDGKIVRKAEFDAKFPAGIHNITLNVTDNKGATASDTLTITVNQMPGTFERIKVTYGTEIKIALLTLVSALFAVIIYLRNRRKGMY